MRRSMIRSRSSSTRGLRSHSPGLVLAQGSGGTEKWCAAAPLQAFWHRGGRRPEHPSSIHIGMKMRLKIVSTVTSKLNTAQLAQRLPDGPSISRTPVPLGASV